MVLMQYLVQFMTETFNTFDKSFNFLVKKQEDNAIAFQTTCQKMQSRGNDYKAITNKG